MAINIPGYLERERVHGVSVRGYLILSYVFRWPLVRVITFAHMDKVARS